MDVSMIASLIVALFALLFAVIYMLKAGKRSWILAPVNLAITVAAIFIAIPLTRTLAELGVDKGYDYFRVYFKPELTSYLEQVPVAAEGLQVLIELAASPLLYLPVFLLTRLVLSLIVKIVEACVPVLRLRTKKYVSMPLGAVNGLLIALVMLIPLCGYICLAANLLDTADETGILEAPVVQESLPEGIMDDVDFWYDALGCHPVLTKIHNTVGAPLFTALTTGNLDETHADAELSMNLEKELDGLLVTASHALDAVESLEKETFTQEDKEHLYATADSLFESDWIRNLGADSLVALSEAWLQNQSFVGLARPALDATINPTVNHLLEILATETPDTLEEDIHVLLDVLGDLLISDLLQSGGNYTEMVQKMSQSGLLTDMVEKLEQSAHFCELADELKALAVRLVSNMLGVDKLENGEYADMMVSVAGTLTDALNLPEAERDAMILDAVKGQFSEQGFDIPDDVTLKMSHHMMEELGADGKITADELTQYMVDHAEEGFEILGDVEIPTVDPEAQP